MIGFSTFLEWVSRPESYNWITLVSAIAASATALFTGYSAFALWIDRRKRVNAEWKLEVGQGGFTLQVLLQNGLGTTIEPERAIVRGPVKSVTASGKDVRGPDKHESWPDNVAPLFPCEVATGEITSFKIHVLPEASALRTKASSWLKRPRFWLTVLAWKTLHWRFSSGVKFSVIILARRRSSTMRPIRLTHSIRIYPAQATKMADTIEKNADNT